ncbi:MAG: hypothetical protein GY853_04670 [PVC group bacterium]|nr:hypothetical protein [PVC group bacterium]
MVLLDIMHKCRNLELFQKRTSTDEHVEVVVFNKDMEEWIRIFSEELGQAVKPAGASPTSRDLELTSAYGGIRGEQSLFEKRSDDSVVIALFWPWQDKQHTTIKMFNLRLKA